MYAWLSEAFIEAYLGISLTTPAYLFDDLAQQDLLKDYGSLKIYPCGWNDICKLCTPTSIMYNQRPQSLV